MLPPRRLVLIDRLKRDQKRRDAVPGLQSSLTFSIRTNTGERRKSMTFRMRKSFKNSLKNGLWYGNTAEARQIVRFPASKTPRFNLKIQSIEGFSLGR